MFMKKLLCLVLSVCFIFAFSSCGKKDKYENTTLDLAKYAKAGEMPEAKYGLGANPDDVIADLSGIEEDILDEEKQEIENGADHDHNHDQEEFYFERVEGENNVMLDNGKICYYYTKANADKGISCIVSYENAYGFALGTLILDVKEALKNVNFTEEPLTEENAFFASYAFDGNVLKAQFDNTTIIFVFQENELFATAIYNEYWNS
jgi:hypothetical protein